MKRKWFYFLLVSSFVLQVIVSLYQTYADTGVFFVPWAAMIEKTGYIGFYDKIISGHYVNYPPFSIYVFVLSNRLGNLLTKPILDLIWWFNITIPLFPSKIILYLNKGRIFFAFMKLANIFADILLAVGSYRLAKNISKNKGSLSNLIFVSLLFNPAILFISPLWGQIDVVPLSLIVWSFYFLVLEKDVLSVLLFTLALLSKQTVALTIPFYLLFYIKNISWKKIIRDLIVFYLTFVSLFFQFQNTLIEKLFPFPSYLKIVTNFESELEQIHAYNFWALIRSQALKDGVEFFLGLSSRQFSVLIVSVTLICIISVLWKFRHDLLTIISGLAVFNLTAFMFMTRLHERHLMIAIPFLAIASLFDFRFYWIFLIESFCLWLNSYAAWPVPRIELLAKLVNEKIFINIFVMIQLLLLIFIYYFWLNKTKGPASGRNKGSAK